LLAQDDRPLKIVSETVNPISTRKYMVSLFSIIAKGALNLSMEKGQAWLKNLILHHTHPFSALPVSSTAPATFFRFD
jgi:hypothetical protein